MNVLVTGGTGFIGSHIAEGLFEAGYSVTALVVLDPYYDTGIKERNADTCRQTGGERFQSSKG